MVIMLGVKVSGKLLGCTCHESNSFPRGTLWLLRSMWLQGKDHCLQEVGPHQQTLPWSYTSQPPEFREINLMFAGCFITEAREMMATGSNYACDTAGVNLCQLEVLQRETKPVGHRATATSSTTYISQKSVSDSLYLKRIVSQEIV